MQWLRVGTLNDIQEGARERRQPHSGSKRPQKSWVPDLHLPLSPSKRPWWRITAKVRKEERGHGEVHDRKEKVTVSGTQPPLCGPPELWQLAEHQIMQCPPKASTNVSAQKRWSIILWSHSSEMENWRGMHTKILSQSTQKKPPLNN